MSPGSLLHASVGHGRIAAIALSAWLVLPGTSAAETIRAGGTGSSLGTLTVLAKAYHRLDPSFALDIVPNLGSSGAVKALLAGSIELAATSRPVNSNEAAAGARDLAYGRTPFLIATKKAGVDSLTLTELAGIYSGGQRKWADGQTIRLVLRPANDGDTALLGTMSPEIRAALDSAMAREGMVIGVSDQDAVDAIERLPGGLGTASLALLRSEQRHAHAIAIDGVAPTPENLASGAYRYGKTMYFVTRENPPTAVTRFIEFAMSAAGRKILAELGHIDPPSR